MAASPEPSQPSKKQSQSNSYLRYSGLAIQLLAAIGIFGWLGYKLDQWLELRYPVFMMVLGLLAFAGSLYRVIKTMNQP